MPTVEYRDVRKDFVTADGEQTSALSDVSFTIRDGEFVSVLGPSGCGKSTLLEITAGLTERTGGEILLDGKPMSWPNRQIGVVFQDSSLFPWRSIRKNVEFGLQLEGVGRAERRERAEETLKKVGLGDFLNKYPHQLSGGMRQRAGLARTLVADPSFILMDEPFSALDYLTRLQLQDEIVQLWQRNRKTILFVTHDVSEAVYMADRVVLLSPHPGRIRHVFDVDLPRPRERHEAHLQEIEQQIYRLLTDPEATI